MINMYASIIEPKHERILIASGISGVQILVARGSGIECDIENAGIKDWDELGFDIPEVTIGLYVIEFITRYNYEDIVRCNVTIRSPTENEWNAFQSGSDILYEMWSDVESWKQYQLRLGKNDHA